MKIKYYLIAGLCMLGSSLFAQMEVDHPIQLTGAGTNAKVTGIQSVTNTEDAASVGALQSGSFIYGLATGTSNNFILAISPAITAYQAGMFFNFISNQNVTGPATLNVNSLGSVPIVKGVNIPLAGCEIQNGQAVTVVYDGTNFQMTSAISPLYAPPTAANAGPNQLNVPGNLAVTLAANTPASGTGRWTIISGEGGVIANDSSPTSSFTGQPSTAYLLQWAISNFCGTTLDTVEISFTISCYIPGSHTFSYTGSLQQFTIPCGVYSLTIRAYGAQGGIHAGGEEGGNGAEIVGTFAVTPDEELNIIVGGQGVDDPDGNIANSGAGGGGGSFAYSTGPTLLVAAGGGGGGALYDDGAPRDEGDVGQTTTCGSESKSCYAGGCAGANGTGDLAGNGWNSIQSSAAGIGLGGYGGGGSAEDHGGGGGGGYSGGGGNNTGGCGANYGDGGGGGGSYNNGTNQTNTSGVQSGNGQVVFTW